MLAHFVDSCPKLHQDEIERKDLMNFTADLKNDGLGDRTTTWLQNDSEIRTVQAWLGHLDMEPTLRYLKAASARKPIVREKINAAFAGKVG